MLHAPNAGDHIVKLWRQGLFYEGRAGELLDWMWNDYYLHTAGERTYVDVGAHWGNHMVFALKSGLFTHAVGFEPEHGNYSTCKHNLEANGVKNYALIKAAIGQENKMGVMHLPDNGLDNSGMMRFRDTLPEVPMLRLNDLAIQSCHLLKIDAEGLEREVLLGGWEFFEKHKPVIAIEVLDEQMDSVSRVLDQIGYIMQLQTANRTPTYIYQPR